VILGGQDGLVNVLGIMLGVIAGGGSDTALLAAGFAAAITESISGAVGYTSSISERDYYQAEKAREATEIATMPDAERQEIRDIYAAKGFSRKLLEDVVDTITANRETWMATMMDEELHLQPVQTADILRTALVITIATLVGQLDSADSVHGSATNVGVGPGDRVERPGPLWSRRLFRGHARGRLAEDRAEDGGHRPRGRSGRLLSSVACSTQPERESDGLGR
jgi:hypothetical protein